VSEALLSQFQFHFDGKLEREPKLSHFYHSFLLMLFVVESSLADDLTHLNNLDESGCAEVAVSQMVQHLEHLSFFYLNDIPLVGLVNLLFMI
jgi:hypothetical protein